MMKTKKIYPVEWRKSHPLELVAGSDAYYADLATKVYDMLVESDIFNNILDSEDLRKMAINLTLWFEDLCTGTGFWQVVNKVCSGRYGRPLPFYNTAEYNPGEPNPQDIQLLLWDFVQSVDDKRIINPENPAIVHIAYQIYDLFYEEYEYAPATDKLKQFYYRPEIGTDYWETRKVIESLSEKAYFSFRSGIVLGDVLLQEYQDAKGDPDRLDISIYAITIAHILTNRHNLLSLTCAEWLSAATGRTFELDTSMLATRMYAINSRSADIVQLRDLATGTLYDVEEESFNLGWLEEYGNIIGLEVVCGLVRFNGKYYQCGSMITKPGREVVEEWINQQRREEHAAEVIKENKEYLLKYSKGEPIIFLKGEKELMDFYSRHGQIEIPQDFKQKLRDTLTENCDNEMLALMPTDFEGTLIITVHIPAINAPNNPYYNQEYAKRHAHEIILSPAIIDYQALCQLIKLNYLPDAALTSAKGYDHGNKFLQNNAQFLADYFFAEHL